jgi:hypothetical protein
MTDEIQQWGIVELMGHKVVADLIQKSEMVGKRVTVNPGYKPESDEESDQ